MGDVRDWCVTKSQRKGPGTEQHRSKTGAEPVDPLLGFYCWWPVSPIRQLGVVKHHRWARVLPPVDIGFQLVLPSFGAFIGAVCWRQLLGWPLTPGWLRAAALHKWQSRTARLRNLFFFFLVLFVCVSGGKCFWSCSISFFFLGFCSCFCSGFVLWDDCNSCAGRLWRWLREDTTGCQRPKGAISQLKDHLVSQWQPLFHCSRDPDRAIWRT